MSRANRVECPHCGESNHLGRALLHPTGMHLRCRECRRTLRVVDTVNGVFLPILALAAGYTLGFWLLTWVWPPGNWVGPVDLVVAAGAPFLLALPAGWLALLASRSGRSEEDEAEPGLPPLAFAGVYLAALMAAIALVSILAFGSLRYRAADSEARVPEPDLPAQPAQVEIEGLDEWSAVELDGSVHRIAELRGKPVLLCLWRPDDPGALPLLHSLHGLRKRVDEVWFVIAAEGPEPEARAFIAERGPRLPHCLAPRPLPPGLEELRAGRGPSVFLLDRHGRLAAYHVGAVNWDLEVVVRFLGRLQGP